MIGENTNIGSRKFALMIGEKINIGRRKCPTSQTS
jgi:hypothetical protein